MTNSSVDLVTACLHAVTDGDLESSIAITKRQTMLEGHAGIEHSVTQTDKLKCDI